MLLVIHIIVAASSLVYSSYLMFKPAASNFYISYWLSGLTLVSGTYLVWSLHDPLTSSCISGLAYLLSVSVMNVTARYRLKNISKV
jgi:hypothetical protein